MCSVTGFNMVLVHLRSKFFLNGGQEQKPFFVSFCVCLQFLNAQCLCLWMTCGFRQLNWKQLQMWVSKDSR